MRLLCKVSRHSFAKTFLEGVDHDEVKGFFRLDALLFSLGFDRALLSKLSFFVLYFLYWPLFDFMLLLLRPSTGHIDPSAKMPLNP